MKEIKRIAKVGETIKITKEHRLDSGKLVHANNSLWKVETVIMAESNPPGLVFVEGSEYGCFPDDYVVLETKND